MVMEMPTPQCVGQEFVRQYYTLLHEAPHVMHRFYSHDSSFVHGGIEKPGEEMPPIMGQMAIHKKIMSLNFRDCHAKIRQVDSQATIDNAVVVQVVGELSNAGQPMRRFMQTFVLAPQSPKKYYVHNDIFRYQDEVFHDVMVEAESDTVENEGKVEPQDAVTDTADLGHQLQPVASNGSSFVAHVTGICQDTPFVPVGDGHVEASVSDATIHVEPQTVKLDSEPCQEITAHVTVASGSPTTSLQQPSTSPLPPPNPVIQPHPAPESSLNRAPEVTKQVSWAALASKGTASNASSVPAKPQATVKPELKPEVPPSVSPLPQRIGTVDRGSVDRDSTSGVGEDGSVTPSDAENGSGRRRYADNLQVFVGNLPHNYTDVELREFFSKFGTVIDVRINRRPTRDVPNFGFVVFDCTEAVQKVLNARPLYIFDDKYRLNVEEKKQQTDYRSAGMSRGTPRGGYRGGYNTGQSAGGMRGGWRGGRGGGRGYNSGSIGRNSSDENSSDGRNYGHASELSRHLQ